METFFLELPSMIERFSNFTFFKFPLFLVIQEVENSGTSDFKAALVILLAENTTVSEEASPGRRVVMLFFGILFGTLGKLASKERIFS